MLRRVILVILLLAAATPAGAHPAPFSYLDVVFRNGNIEGTLVVHVLDVAHDFKVDPPDRLFDRNFLGPLRQQIAGMLAPRINLRTDRRLQLEWTDVVAVPDDQTLRLTFRVSREQPGARRPAWQQQEDR